MSITFQKPLAALLYFAIFWFVNSYHANAGFDKNPVLETQSGSVAVTEETLKDEGRSGAPAPSFKLLEDTGKFFVEDPVEKIKEEKAKKWGWWFFQEERKEAPEEQEEMKGPAFEDDLTVHE